MTNTGWPPKLHKADSFEEGRISDVSDQCLFEVYVAVHGLLSPGRPGGVPEMPCHGRSVNPISTREDRLYSPNNTGTPIFSDLPTALPECFTKVYRKGTQKDTGRIRQISTVFFKKLALKKRCVTTVFIFASRVAGKQSLSIY